MELLTIEDMAKFFDVKVNTVKCWVQNKTIPKEAIFKIGKKRGTLRFIKSRVEDWINVSLQA